LLILSKAALPAEFAIVVLIIGFAALTLPFAYILLKKLNVSDERSLQLMQQLEDRSQKLNNSNKQLRAKNTELDSLLHIISHDLKAPSRPYAPL
jgi:signal transduction histidine kinase